MERDPRHGAGSQLAADLREQLYLYGFSKTVRKIDPANGSEVWQATSAAAGSTVPRRMTGCLVTATYIVKIDITSNENIFCINESHGSAFCRDSLTANQSPNAQAQSAIVSPDGRLTSELVLVVMGGICPMAIFLLGLRINQQSFRENGPLVVGTIVTCVGPVAAGIWTLRR